MKPPHHYSSLGHWEIFSNEFILGEHIPLELSIHSQICFNLERRNLETFQSVQHLFFIIASL